MSVFVLDEVVALLTILVVPKAIVDNLYAEFTHLFLGDMIVKAKSYDFTGSLESIFFTTINRNINMKSISHFLPQYGQRFSFGM
jgi:hypothetical protein